MCQVLGLILCTLAISRVASLSSNSDECTLGVEFTIMNFSFISYIKFIKGMSFLMAAEKAIYSLSAIDNEKTVCNTEPQRRFTPAYPIKHPLLDLAAPGS